MTKVLAGITTSVDGYVAGPDDRPGQGLGKGGERLHYWVFGGPWTYDDERTGDATGEDAEWLSEVMSRVGAVVSGRYTYEGSGPLGRREPVGVPGVHRDPSAGGGAGGGRVHVRRGCRG